MSTNVNVGDRVEVVAKKLKTNGQKGTIKRLDFLLHVLMDHESGYPGFHDRFKTVTFRNGTKVYVNSHDIDECNTVLVVLDSGKNVTMSLSKLKVISKVTRPTVDINCCYTLRNPISGHEIQGQVVNCEFNENREDGCYIFLRDPGSYDVINTTEYDIKLMTNEEFVEFENLLKENDERMKRVEKMNKLFSIVIKSETLNTIVERYSPQEQTGGFFDGTLMMDRGRPPIRGTLGPLSDFVHYDMSFTVKGYQLEQAISDVVRELNIDPQYIKVYELMNEPKSVKVNVSVDIE